MRSNYHPRHRNGRLQAKEPCLAGARLQRGFIAYVLGAAALLLAIGVAAIQQVRTNTQGNYVFETTKTLYAAGVLIQTKIRYCPLAYPGGNNGTGFAPQYPTGATAVLVSTLVCPGRSAYALFTGGDGVFLPVTPTGFDGWWYVNDANGVRIYLVSDGTNPRNSTLSNVAAKFSSTAASFSGSTLTLWIKR